MSPPYKTLLLHQYLPFYFPSSQKLKFISADKNGMRKICLAKIFSSKSASDSVQKNDTLGASIIVFGARHENK
jgi:hypothetical protein